MRTIDTIIIHCAATPPTMNIGVAEIDRWHSARGFFAPDHSCSIGYHFVIRRDGTIEEGRPIQFAGAHAKGHNATSIGICLVGGVDKNNRPQCNFTEMQWIGLNELINQLTQDYHITKIIGHNQVANKACPCFSVPHWLVHRSIAKENIYQNKGD